MGEPLRQELVPRRRQRLVTVLQMLAFLLPASSITRFPLSSRIANWRPTLAWICSPRNLWASWRSSKPLRSMKEPGGGWSCCLSSSWSACGSWMVVQVDDDGQGRNAAVLAVGMSASPCHPAVGPPPDPGDGNDRHHYPDKVSLRAAHELSPCDTAIVRRRSSAALRPRVAAVQPRFVRSPFGIARCRRDARLFHRRLRQKR